MQAIVYRYADWTNTALAAVNYMHIREYWEQVHESPIAYRYTEDWSRWLQLCTTCTCVILSLVQN